MKKSVYSLVLMDEVVRSIDALAYSLGTSRSSLINQILAERVAVITPKKHLQLIFDEMSKIFAPYQNFQVQSQSSDSIYSVRSALRYKYNPTIKYAVTMYKQNNTLGGELKIISRTQSETLLNYLNTFLKIWSEFERKHNRRGWSLEDGQRWSRNFSFEYEETFGINDEIAEEITEYIRAVDRGLAIYFSNLELTASALKTIHEHYKSYLKKSTLPF